MNLKEIIKTLLTITVIIAVTWYVTYNFIYPYTISLLIEKFIYSLPVIFGILLTGVLAGAAIVLGMLDATELSKISQYEKQEGINAFSDIISGIKIDVYLILSFFIIFSFLTQIPINDSITRELLAAGNSALVLSCYAAYDIIRGLFIMIETKYINTTKNNKNRGEKS